MAPMGGKGGQTSTGLRFPPPPPTSGVARPRARVLMVGGTWGGGMPTCEGAHTSHLKSARLF